MAQNLLTYKHIGVEDETSYGAGATGTATRLTVRTFNLELDPNKELVEDTTVSVKGRDRVVALRNVLEGDLTAYGTPRNLNAIFEMGFGTTAISTTLGSSAQILTYNQNTSGVWFSKAMNKDFNNSQERFTGVVAKSMELTASDGLLEATASLMAQTRQTGITMFGLVGETLKPWSFSDFTVYAARGSSANGLTILPVSEWTITYENNIEGAFQSGSKNITRVNPGIPTVTGSIKIFHDNNGTYRDATYGCTELFLRFDAQLATCHGSIAGVTPFFLRIDIPRVSFTTNTVPYEQAGIATEEISFTGMVEAGVSYLMQVQMTTELTI